MSIIDKSMYMYYHPNVSETNFVNQILNNLSLDQSITPPPPFLPFNIYLISLPLDFA